MPLRTLLVAVAVTVTLSACSLDRVIGRGESDATPATGSAGTGAPTTRAGSSVSPDRVVKAASEAVGAQVVVKPGQYLLCNTIDRYKGRVTTYYTCRERRCVGQETPATDVAAPKTKAGCLNTCRKLETTGTRDASVRSYCAG